VGSGPNKAVGRRNPHQAQRAVLQDHLLGFCRGQKAYRPVLRAADHRLRGRIRGTVIGDIIKDTAIFKAHKAAPVVIADEGEDRFAPYAEDVFPRPPGQPQLAPILNTLVGHIWGYHAALAINDGSRFLYDFREVGSQHP
jgi:hypothetical protein